MNCGLYNSVEALYHQYQGRLFFHSPTDNHVPGQAHIRPTASGYISLLTMHLQCSKHGVISFITVYEILKAEAAEAATVITPSQSV